MGLLSTKTIICPFCFEEFSSYELRLRCMKLECKGKAPDTLFAHARSYAPTIMGRVLVPGKGQFRNGLPYQVRCDYCNTVSHTLLCPTCHFELPYDIGQIEQKIIAIIGARASGKSHYIASLINRLERVVANSFNMSLQKVGNETEERWVRDFYTPLFVRKTVLQPNKPASIDPQVRIPLIFRLIVRRNGYTHALNLSFFDTAGEDMTSANIMAVHNRYIFHADGIIFLLDPLQIPQVQQELHLPNMPALNARSSPMSIIGQLRELFEREQRVRASQRVPIPIAFTLSKIDALEPILYPGSPLKDHSQHQGYLDLREMQSVSTEVSNYLKGWIGPSFGLSIEHYFQCYEFFAMSSLGHQPEQNNKLKSVSPRRVEDPFLWLLYKLGLIRGRR